MRTSLSRLKDLNDGRHYHVTYENSKVTEFIEFKTEFDEFLASLNDVQILLNNIVFVVSPGNGFIGSLNMKLWGQPEASFDTFQN